MWLLLVLFQFTTFAIGIETEAECHALAELSLPLWKQNDHDVHALCMKTHEI